MTIHYAKTRNRRGTQGVYWAALLCMVPIVPAQAAQIGGLVIAQGGAARVKPLDMLHDPTRMDAQWDIYVLLKFTGPAYPYGKPNEKNAIYFDRMILLNAQD